MYRFYYRAREMDALAQRPNLDTVKEESEEEANGKDKQGQTELHKLAAQEGTGEIEKERERAIEMYINSIVSKCKIIKTIHYKYSILNRCRPDSFAEAWVQLGREGHLLQDSTRCCCGEWCSGQHKCNW